MKFQWLRHLLSKLVNSIMSIIARGQVTVATVEDGKQGAQGAVVTYRGAYSATAFYYGSAVRCDIVKYNGSYYKTKSSIGGGITNISPTNTSNWESFGAQFDSVATDLLLAENANIGCFIFRDGKLISQRGTVNGAESTDYTNAQFVPYITLDGTNGSSTIRNGEFYGGVRTLFYAVNSATCTSLGSNQFKVTDKLNLVAEGLYTEQLNILLPNDTSFIGKQVNIHNPVYALTRMSLMYQNATIVRAEEGYIYYKPFLGSQDDITFSGEINSTTSIEFMAGTLSFLCVPGQGGTVNAVVRWLCLNYPNEGTNSGGGSTSSGDVAASGTLTSNRIILGAGSKSIKASAYAIQTVLTNSGSYLPTSNAVYAAIEQAKAESGNVQSSETLTANKVVLGGDDKNIKSSSFTIQTTFQNNSTHLPTSSAVKTYVDSAIQNAGAEWYNIFTRKGTVNDALYTVIENCRSTIVNNTNYRLVLLKYRKQKSKGRVWSMPMYPYEFYNQGRSQAPSYSTIAEQNTWWPITSMITPWFGQTGANYKNVISLNSKERNGKYYWKNTRNKRMKVGVAIFKFTNIGNIGWQRISNIAYVEFYKINNIADYMVDSVI